jgi:hypothetical protein
MTTTTTTDIPATLNSTLMKALLHSNCSADVDEVQRIVKRQLNDSEREDGAVNLTPLFRYLARMGTQGRAAGCVREVAEGMRAAGVPAYVPELVLRRAPVRSLEKADRLVVVGGAPVRRSDTPLRALATLCVVAFLAVIAALNLH